MTDIVWGSAIAVDGKRPDWLGSYSGGLGYQRESDGWFGPDENVWTEKDILIGRMDGSGWFTIEAIRLPADHFAYAAIAAGFVPWGGGDEAPADWDGGEILVIDGRKLHAKNVSWRWSHQHDGVSDIIGYRRRTEQPAGDTVPYSLDYWLHLHTAYTPEGLGRYLGLIREPTEAECIATDTGIDLATVERVLTAKVGAA